MCSVHLSTLFGYDLNSKLTQCHVARELGSFCFYMSHPNGVSMVCVCVCVCMCVCVCVRACVCVCVCVLCVV